MLRDVLSIPNPLLARDAAAPDRAVHTLLVRLAALQRQGERTARQARRFQEAPMPIETIEPVVGQDGRAVDLSDFVAQVDAWTPLLSRMLACDGAQLQAVVADLATDQDGDPLFAALKAFQDLARRCEAASKLFRAGHDRLAAAAEKLAAG